MYLEYNWSVFYACLLVVCSWLSYAHGYLPQWTPASSPPPPTHTHYSCWCRCLYTFRCRYCRALIVNHNSLNHHARSKAKWYILPSPLLNIKRFTPNHDFNTWLGLSHLWSHVFRRVITPSTPATPPIKSIANTSLKSFANLTSKTIAAVPRKAVKVVARSRTETGINTSG